MCEIRCDGTGTEAEGEWSTAYGLYSDRYRRLERGWMFADRSYRSLARTGAGGVVLPFPDST